MDILSWNIENLVWIEIKKARAAENLRLKYVRTVRYADRFPIPLTQGAAPSLSVSIFLELNVGVKQHYTIALYQQGVAII